MSSAARPSEAALQKRLSVARQHCDRRGAQLTTQRSEVLELLLRRGGQAKAYDLQDDMQARHGRIAPTTVYRALDFLQEQQLVHKVDATNTFVVCEHADHAHPALLAICTRCGRIDEMHDTKPAASLLALVERQGMTPHALEVKCLCANCHDSEAATA